MRSRLQPRATVSIERSASAVRFKLIELENCDAPAEAPIGGDERVYVHVAAAAAAVAGI